MAKLHNDILIDASIDKIWEALTVVDKLDTYDPTVKKSTAITGLRPGVGAKRKVDMLDGKNWFEEMCTVSKSNEALPTPCSAGSTPWARSSQRLDRRADGLAPVVPRTLL